MASQTIPLSGKNLSRGRIADAEAAAALETLRRAEIDAVRDARVAYYRLANAHVQVEINRRNEALLAQFVEISRARLETGTEAQSGVFLAEIELIRLIEARVDIERELAASESALNVLMNRPARAPIGRPAALKLQPLRAEAAQLEAFAMENRPEVRLAQRQVDAGAARLQLARREWFPDPQLRLEVRQFRSEMDGRSGEFDTGIFFNVPWVNYRKYSAAVREARSSLEMNEAEAEAAGVAAAGLIRNQLEKIRAFAHHYELFRSRIVPLARQTVETTRAGYEADRAGFLELSLARQRFAEAESMLAHHLMEHEIAKAELDAIVGAGRSSAITQKRRSK